MSAASPLMNPFPGLRPFTQEEDYLFFGREEQTIELLQRLGGNRFVAVVGTSGSGKSSLVRCGLLSQLLGGKMRGAGAAWEIAVTHPGGNPLALLTDALLEADLYDRAAENARENLLATLSRSHFGLVEAVKQADLGEGTNFLLVVDQFEEIFRFHEAGQIQQEVANEFVSLLLEAAAQKEAPIYVVLTMRSDFIGECGQFEGLAEMVNQGEFLIPRLNREQYKRVIEGPIKVAGGQIAPRLLQRLLNDLGQQADQLPCLQHALMRTWDVWAQNRSRESGARGQESGARGQESALLTPGPLDLDDYQRVGKMSQALSLHADEIYQSLASDRQRELCQGIFQALTVEESNSRGIRRPQRLGRLCQILEVSASELAPIIDAYRQSGVTFLMPSPEVELTDHTIIDISHESLMRVWTRLRQWVEEETQAAGIYHRLSESADLHERGKAGPYRDPELGIALAWRETKRPNAAWAERYRPGFTTAIGFLETSQRASVAEEQAREATRQRELVQAQQLAEAQQLRLEQELRSTRKLRTMIWGLAVVAIVAVVACVAALVANNNAKTLAELASKREGEANRQRKLAENAAQETKKALTQVETSLKTAEKAEQVARAAEETGRKLLYTTDMRLAPFVWRDDRTTAEQLRVLLAKHIPDREAATLKPDLRGFEWHYYQHLLESSAAVFSGHPVSVVGGAFTTNGQLVTLDQNDQVRRWNQDTRDEDVASRRDLPKGGGDAIRILSPDGRFAALADGKKVHVFDTATGKEQFQIDFAQALGRRLIFTPDSNRLVIVDDKIRWCNAANGTVIASVNEKFNRGSSLAVSADGLTLAVVGHGFLGNHFSIFRLDPATKKVTPLAKDAGPGGTLSASALSPDGSLIALGLKLSGPVTLYETATGRLVVQHRAAHASPVSAMTFSGDGLKLVTADVEGTIKIWEDARKMTSKSAAAMTFKGHEAAITDLGFSPSGKQLVSTSADKTARVWDMDNVGAAIRVLERAGPGCLVARFSPDGLLIAAADGPSVRLWDAATGRLVRELSATDKGRVCSVAFSPTDHRLLAVGYGGQAGLSHVELWDIDAGRELARLPGAADLPDIPPNDEYAGMVSALAFSPDGKYLVAGFGSPNLFTPKIAPSPLKVWEVATRRLIRRLSGHTGFCVSLDFSSDGTRFASGSRDGTAIIWSAATWKAMQTLRNPDPGPSFSQSGRGMVDDVAFSPDGKTLAMASREGSLLLWGVADGNLLATLKGHSGAVEAVKYSPDGRTLATGGGDQTVRLWNVETRRELMQLDSGNVELGSMKSLAFSPDGTQLLAGGRIGIAFWSTAPIVWNDPDRAAEILRRLLQSNADFKSRIRMLSENLRLHEALEKLNSKVSQVPAALAATRANWHAAHGRWGEAAKEYDRFREFSPDEPQAWLRTPGLIRIATALFHEGRPAQAATLLTGGAKRRLQDGLQPVAETVNLGIKHEKMGDYVRISGLVPGSPAARSKLQVGDFLVKVMGFYVSDSNSPKLSILLNGKTATNISLTVRHPRSGQMEDLELAVDKYLSDDTTGELWRPLLAAIDARLVKNPTDVGLLEFRAELVGQWSDTKAQLADYTAAIEALSLQKPAVGDLKRLYGRRGNAYVRLERWQEALGDFAHVVTKDTTDEEILNNQAIALAAVMLRPKRQDAAVIFAAPWARLVTAYWLGRDQRAVDQLVEGRAKLAGQIGDLFIQDQDRDWSRAVEIYSRGITATTTDAVLFSKRARAYEALKNWDGAAADWARAATGNPEAADLLAEFAFRLVASDQVPLANSYFEKAQALYERLLGADPDNDLLATELALLLFQKHQIAPATLDGEGNYIAVLKVTDPWLKLGAAYAVNGRSDEASQYFSRALWRADGSDARFTLPSGMADLLRGSLLDDATKAKLRGQALDLLRADLALRRKQLESDKPSERAQVHGALYAWQMDENLAGLRDAAALAKLPPDQQKAFTQFWAEVTDLFYKAIAAAPADKQMDVVTEWLKERNPGFDGKVTHKAEGGVVTSVEMPSPLVQDLTPLRALSGLRSLTCRSTLGYDNRAESDAAVLRSLKTLENINGKPVAEFWKDVETRQAEFQEWLQRIPTLPAEQQMKEVAAKLKERNPGSPCYVQNLSKSDEVTEIWVHEAYNLTDLSPVRALAGLKSFKMDAGAGGHLTDVSPLTGLKHLTHIHLGGMKVRDLAPLKGMPLTMLDLGHCPLVSDLEPLKGMPLTSLNLTLCTHVHDLTPLKGMPLTFLNLHDGPKVEDLTPLKGMKLTELWLGGNRMRDLAPLKGMPLKILALSHCSLVQNLAPLQDLPLTTLYLDNTLVRDLEPLRKMPLKKLYIDAPGVTDVTPLKALRLEDIRLTPKNITQGLEILRGMKSLTTIGLDHYKAWPAADFWARFKKDEFK